MLIKIRLIGVYTHEIVKNHYGKLNKMEKVGRF